MRTKNMTLETFETFTVKFACGFASMAFLLLVGLMLLVAGFAESGYAQELQPKTFSSPAEASAALFQAAQNEDEQALEAILGAGKEVTSSSDEVEDKLEREQFAKKYQEMHRLVREPDGSTVLYIGAENWPFPVPLISKDGVWYFDSETGKREITFRRLGENEATAIEVCTASTMAKNQGETRAMSDDDSISQYAQRLIAGGAENESSPFHGYYFRIAKEKSAMGNNSHVSGDKKKDGLALVAYPAEYRSSGVKTFVVSQDGTVYEKDLGPDTTKVAPSIKARDSSWRPAE
ncbi:MAG TPA: DUF2950 family protein [Candidatus Dormibacteraeota bacterium]|jgi:hypothetical protein|nr:DUF2950 family protein [Candidatus Dormibacteraeota bacterium]